MKRKIYELFTPKSFQENIYRAAAEQFDASEVARLSAIEKALPPAELSSAYIANLSVLTDRHAFLHAMQKDAIVGEIGIQNGEFADKLLAITSPRKLYLIGTRPSQGGHASLVEQQIRMLENKFREEITAGQVAINRRSLIIELEAFSDGYFDWLYIDADRSFEAILNTLELCRLKVKENGIIAGRNYTIGSILTRARYGVIEAVNRFCKQYGWEMVYLTNETHRNLAYALRKMVPQP